MGDLSNAIEGEIFHPVPNLSGNEIMTTAFSVRESDVTPL